MSNDEGKEHGKITLKSHYKYNNHVRHSERSTKGNLVILYLHSGSAVQCSAGATLECWCSHWPGRLSRVWLHWQDRARYWRREMENITVMLADLLMCYSLLTVHVYLARRYSPTTLQYLVNSAIWEGIFTGQTLSDRKTLWENIYPSHWLWPWSVWFLAQLWRSRRRMKVGPDPS